MTGRIQLHVGSRRPRRPLQERRRNRQAEGLGGFEVDDELILRGCSTGRFHISRGTPRLEAPPHHTPVVP